MNEEDTATEVDILLARQIEQLQRSVTRLEECVVALLEETQRALRGVGTALDRGRAIGGRSQPSARGALQEPVKRLAALHKKLTAVEAAIAPSNTLARLAASPEEIKRLDDEGHAAGEAFMKKTASMEGLAPHERLKK